MFSVNKLPHYIKVIESDKTNMFITRHKRIGKTTFLADLAIIFYIKFIFNIR